MSRAESMLREWPVGAVAAALADGDELRLVGEIDRRFPIASVTKLATALAVLVAAEEGIVNLDVDLDGDLDVPGAPGPGLAVADLLAHSSGLGPDAVVGGDGTPRYQRLAPAGRRRIYSNAGYELAAAAVGDRSGLGFPIYLREAVLEPLGMTSTELAGSPAAGLTSTARDLARLLAELRRPRLVSATTAARLHRSHRPGLSGVLPGFGHFADNAWGLGPEIRAGKAPHWTGTHNSPATFGHFGRRGSFLWWDPVAAKGAAVLTDRDFGPWSLDAWPAFADAWLEGDR